MLEVCVVGAGIAGSWAARLLARRGHRVVLVERAADRPGGAGIVLTPRALASLAAGGVRPPVRVLPGGLVIRAGGGARVLASGPRAALRRDALAAALAHDLRDLVEVRSATPLLGIRRVEGAAVCVFPDGEQRFDLVVGADGLRSTVREALRPDVAMRSSGQVCWRGVVPGVLADAASETWSGAIRVGVVPLPDSSTYVYVVARGGRDAVLPRAPRLGADASAALDALRGPLEGPLLQHGLSEVARPVWGAGPVVLIGDAAHGMLPNLGAGAALAIADADALAMRLDHGIAGLVRRVARARSAETEVTRHLSRALGRLAHPAGAAPRRIVA